MELLTSATQTAIETAVTNHDKAILVKYGRFLPAMIESILRKDPGSSHTEDLRQTLVQIYNSYLAQNAAR